MLSSLVTTAETVKSLKNVLSLLNGVSRYKFRLASTPYTAFRNETLKYSVIKFRSFQLRITAGL
jgi:hypothetical protein